MPTIRVLIALILVSSIRSQEIEFPFRENVDLEIGAYRGHCRISTERSLIARGSPFEIEVEFHNTGESHQFYNVFLRRTIPISAQLAIYDGEMKYIGDLLYEELSSRQEPNSSDWTRIPTGGSVRTRMTLIAGRLESKKFGKEVHLLPVGTYYVQMIFYKSFLSPPPRGQSPRESFDSTELFRSNSIKFTLADV